MLFGKQPTADHLTAGQHAEDSALAFLRSQGLVLVERNYRCRGGEIDLIMRDGGKIVFVEVRFRSDQRFGGALASVDRHKQARLIHAASHYLAAKHIDRPARFDVAAVSPDQGKLEIQWIKDAFQAG
jgi:putative endonuclease